MARTKNVVTNDGDVEDTSFLDDLAGDPEEGEEQAVEAKAPAVKKVAYIDDEGRHHRSDGTIDKRYGNNGLPKAKVAASAGEPGVGRQEQLTQLWSGKDWDIVGEGFDPEGRKSASGFNVKKFFVLRIKGTDGPDYIAGEGEMRKYAGVAPVAKVKGGGQKKALKVSEFNEGFALDGDEAPTGEADSLAEFLDEPA